MSENSRKLRIRLITAFIGAPLVFWIMLQGGLLFAGLVLIVMGIALWEFWRLIRAEPRALGLMLFGLFYIAFPLGLMIWVRLAANNGIVWTFTILFANWATDTGAYFGGRLFGRHKLAPRLSPNKTLEGAIVGAISGAVFGMVMLGLTGALSVLTAPLPAIVGMSTVLGDLFESWLKRRYTVKDAGTLLPGHGGLLDRIDGTLFSAVTGALYLALIGML
jgi:phosphatidate cytidylyltransferase